jgi:hypothetical protein
MPLDQAHTHGTDWIQIDDDGGVLGPLLNAQVDPQGVEAGTFCYSRAGGRWWGCVVSNPATSTHAWALIGGGGPAPSPGAMLLYVVAEAGTPMAVTGTFPDIDAAITQALADFGATPLNADFLVLPGTYPSFSIIPGAHIAALTEDSPAGNAVRITDTATVSGSFNDPSHRASVSGLLIDVVGVPAVLEDAVVPPSAGRVVFRQCQLAAQGAIGVSFPNGAMAVEFVECQVTGSGSVEGLQIDVTALNTRFDGSIDVRSMQGNASRLAGGQLRLASASTSDLQSCILEFSADPYVTLENGHELNVSGGALTAGLPGTVAVTTATSGTVNLLSGSWPGAKLYTGNLTINSSTNGRAYRGQDVEQLAVGPTVFLVEEDAELVVFAAGIGASSSTLRLPDPSTLPPNREVLVKRIDSDVSSSCSVDVAGGFTIDALGSAVASVVLGPNDSYRLVSRRATALGGACWLRVP